jgi:hypothetical protein
MGVPWEERVARRALMAVLVTWVPLLVLSAVQGLAYGQQVRIPFLRDFAAYARFLVGLPLLIFSEVGIDKGLKTAVTHFLKSGLVKYGDLPSFEALIRRVTRLRDSALPEIALLALACFPSVLRQNLELPIHGMSSWEWAPAGSGTLSYAGWWFNLVSAPLIRFLLFRWLWRICLWASFLWRVLKLDLALTPAHPDKVAGTGFLSDAQSRFSLIAFAIGAMITGLVGNAIAYEGATLTGLKFVIPGYCVLVIVFLAAPLLPLAPTLLELRRRGLREYGALATGYTQMFDAKWIHGKPPEGEALLGSADIQSLADLSNSFALVNGMRLVPIDKRTILNLVVAAVLPMTPVLILAAAGDPFVRTALRLLMKI